MIKNIHEEGRESMEESVTLSISTIMDAENEPQVVIHEKRKRFVPKATKPIKKDVFSDALLERLKDADSKIARSTIRGCYKRALLNFIRRELKVKRLPKRPDGQPYHKLSRWQLLEVLVTEGVKDLKLTHKQLWEIRKGSKHTRKNKKPEVQEEPGSVEMSHDDDKPPCTPEKEPAALPVEPPAAPSKKTRKRKPKNPILIQTPVDSSKE